MVKKLNLNAIRINGGTQPRERINMEAVGEYAEAITAGADLPPVVVFHDGAEYWLADGFHRWHAHKQAGKASVHADVHAGSLDDAKLFASGSNGAHGLRRTNEDKRRAVLMALAVKACQDWSDTKVAHHCCVSVTFVSALRRPEVAAKQQENRAASAEKAAKRSPTTAEQPAGDRSPTTAPAATAVPPSPAKPQQATEAVDDFDPLAELEAAHAEITKLSEEIKAAEADDLKAEAIKWRRSYEHAQRQQSEAMDRAKQATDREAWTMKQLRRCGKAVGVDDPKKIAAAVEAMVRERATA
jgi:uncharacterized ParB-like nuclease family protein